MPVHDPALETAYLETDYWVEDAPNGPFAIRIGEFCIGLEELLLEQVVAEWAFVTACNPGSTQISEAENVQRMLELEAAARLNVWRFYRGCAKARINDWPPEPSLLILDIPRRDAIKLAKRFGQNAIVTGRIAEPARLVWTR